MKQNSTFVSSVTVINEKNIKMIKKAIPQDMASRLKNGDRIWKFSNIESSGIMCMFKGGEGAIAFGEHPSYSYLGEWDTERVMLVIQNNQATTSKNEKDGNPGFDFFSVEGFRVSFEDYMESPPMLGPLSDITM